MERTSDQRGDPDAADWDDLPPDPQLAEDWEAMLPRDPLSAEDYDTIIQALLAEMQYLDPIDETQPPDLFDEVIPVDPFAAWLSVDPRAERRPVDPSPERLPADPFEEQPVDPIAAGIQHVARLEQDRAALEAEQARALANLVQLAITEAGPRPDLAIVYRSLTAELAMAAHLSDRTFQTRINTAETLVNKFPATVTALETGSIGIGHARVIVESGEVIGDPELRARYEHAVLERAGNITPGRLRKLTQVAAAKLGEVTFEDRHTKAVADRSVRIGEIGDGMSEVIHTIATVHAVAIRDRLTQQGKAIKKANPDDPRSLDQVRADLATELFLTGQPSGCPDAPHQAGVGIRAEVSILIPVLTLLGKSDEPATIAGSGPIGLQEAIRLAADAPTLVRVLTHPVSDQVLAVDTYRPSKQLARFLRARDGRCRCPICNRSAARAEIDHTLDWQYHGKTKADNLSSLCPPCHTLKHLPGWTVKQTSPGVLEWTSPHGIVATDYPDTPVRFE
ncbi:HNH endonuclease signature motif containing protein [Salinibacterium sp. ZJ450]|uniref:HNH endonuclease n=1 Tax=Salinibacterium sp. ZJ450 TaxID=2708338 RepID=UPI00141E8058|nr:HNH endonuclease signature motif containing protein [Salinibacterium sp. ZJ450]